MKDKSGLLAGGTAITTTTAAAIPSDGMAGSDGDLLLGAAAITDFVNELSATRVNRRQVYYWLEEGHLPSGARNEVRWIEMRDPRTLRQADQACSFAVR